MAITGSSFKQAITATFGIICGNKFLPMQLIYGRKTERSISRVKFLDSFSLSANEKHFSNTLESLKLLGEIVIPYVEKVLETFNCETTNQLCFFFVFSGPLTEPMIKKIRENSIKLVTVPPNMIQLF